MLVTKPLAAITLLLLIFTGQALFAQTSAAQNTAAELDSLLASEQLTAALAARFALDAAELLPPGLTASEAQDAAYAMATERGWLKKDAAANIPLRDVSYLVMRAFNIKGGIMYSLAPSPRYAYRELVYRRVIQGRVQPNMAVSGLRLLQMLDRAVAFANPHPAPPDEPYAPIITHDYHHIEEETVAILEEIQETIEEIADTTVQITEIGVMIRLENIQFVADSAQLAQSEMAKLDIIAAILMQYPERGILVAGHTAVAGTQAGQLALSEQRAESAAAYFTQRGINRGRITVRGYGAEQPIASNATPEGMARNRRVEITLLHEQAPQGAPR